MASERDIYEVANQLIGYVDPSTPEHLAEFLLREGHEAGRLAEQIERLRDALEPFAKVCSVQFNDWCPDETPAWYGGDDDEEPASVTIGDFRLARAALEGSKRDG